MTPVDQRMPTTRAQANLRDLGLGRSGDTADRSVCLRAGAAHCPGSDGLPAPRTNTAGVFTAQHREHVVSALAQARAVVPDLPHRPTVSDWSSAKRALGLAWLAVSTQMRQPSAPELITARIDALERIRRVEQTIPAHVHAERDAVARLEAALILLRGTTSTHDLLRNSTEAVSQLGFDRALVSAVREGRWSPLWVSDPRDPSWAERILEIGRADEQPLDGRLLESDLIVHRSRVLVRDAQHNPRVHRELARVSRTESYIAVPLISNRMVIGFLHADCYYQGREPDEHAGKLLGVFAEVVTQGVLRAAVSDQLAAIESGITSLSESLAGTDWSTPRSVSLRADPRRSNDRGRLQILSLTDRYRLTKRQTEVLELVAEGHTNAVIGTRLFITQDTVKSHVKSLLRKFNAGNRAELVSRWLNFVNQ